MSYRFKRNTLALIVGLTLGGACTYAQAKSVCDNPNPPPVCGSTPAPTPVVGPITVSPPITVAPITTVTPVIAPVTHINPVTVVAPTITNESNNANNNSVNSTNNNSNNNFNSNAAQGGAGGNGYGSAAASASTSAQGGSVVSSGNSENSGNNTGTANVVVQGDQAQERNPVASAVAPTVYTGTDQCLVPVSMGGQAVGFGLSFGVAVRDEICEVLKLSRQLEYLTDKATALNFLRMHDKRVDAALKAAGK